MAILIKFIKFSGCVLMLVLALTILSENAQACTWWCIHTPGSNALLINEQLNYFQANGSLPSGWSYIGYKNDNQMIEYRSKLSSFSDPAFKNKINELVSSNPNIIIVHNWLRVTGPVGIPNPYPHLRLKNGKWYALGDNGVSNMPALFNAIEKTYLAENTIKYGTKLEEYQMGELWLLLVLQEVEKADWNSEKGFINAIKKMGNEIHASLVFSDGESIWCYSDRKTLFYYFDKNSNDTIVSSGAKSGDNIDWKTIEGGRTVFGYPGARRAPDLSNRGQIIAFLNIRLFIPSYFVRPPHPARSCITLTNRNRKTALP